jgi:hypothetical protein
VVTLDYQVSTPEDDGYWTSSSFANNTINLLMGASSGTVRNLFIRFAGVTIPAGSKIVSAYMSFYFYDSAETPPECALYFEDAANPSAVKSRTDGNGRVKTTASIGITSPTSGTWWNSNDISAIIQELVDSYDYSSGSAMQCIINGGSPYSGEVYSCDYSDPALAPKLHIEYGTNLIQATSRGMFNGFFRKMG